MKRISDSEPCQSWLSTDELLIERRGIAKVKDFRFGERVFEGVEHFAGDVGRGGVGRANAIAS